MLLNRADHLEGGKLRSGAKVERRTGPEPIHGTLPVLGLRVHYAYSPRKNARGWRAFRIGQI